MRPATSALPSCAPRTRGRAGRVLDDEAVVIRSATEDEAQREGQNDDDVAEHQAEERAAEHMQVRVGYEAAIAAKRRNLEPAAYADALDHRHQRVAAARQGGGGLVHHAAIGDGLRLVVHGGGCGCRQIACL